MRHIRAFALNASGVVSDLPSAGRGLVCASGDDGANRKGTAASSVRFCDNNNGTLIDGITGLAWLQDADSAGAVKTWSAALDYVDILNNDAAHNCGYTDWRLPTVYELEFLTHCAQLSPCAWLINQGFINVQGSYYWSSTSYAPDAAFAWFVNMYSGDVSIYCKMNGGFVWPVRSARKRFE